MAQLSIDDEPGMVVSDVDVRRPGPTYTVDTMIDVRREEPPARWWFIVGADAFANLPTWHQAQRLGGLARFAVVPRPGTDLAAVTATKQKMESLGMPLEMDLIEMPAIDISSSQIRALVGEGQSIKGMVTDAVADYIVQHGLYQAGSHEGDLYEKSEIA